MVVENEALKALLTQRFPDEKHHTNDIPQGMHRPCIVYFDPEDKVEIKEMTKLSYKQTKTLIFIFFYEKNNSTQGDVAKQAIEQIIMAQKKVPLPGTDGRHMSIDGFTCIIDQNDSRVECELRVSRVLPRRMPA